MPGYYEFALLPILILITHGGVKVRVQLVFILLLRIVAVTRVAEFEFLILLGPISVHLLQAEVDDLLTVNRAA